MALFSPTSLSGTTIFLFYIYFRSCDQGLNPNHYRTIPVPFPFHYRGYPRLYLIHYRTLVGLFAHKICSCKSGKNGKVPHFILIRLVPFLTKLVPFFASKGNKSIISLPLLRMNFYLCLLLLNDSTFLEFLGIFWHWWKWHLWWRDLFWMDYLRVYYQVGYSE